jgi:hypothetical protein
LNSLKIELESLNKSCDDINRLEKELEVSSPIDRHASKEFLSSFEFLGGQSVSGQLRGSLHRKLGLPGEQARLQRPQSQALF